jgi:alpha-D-xyloside xylohydrolase
VYLPSSPVWYDFWSGARKTGGVEIDADAPLDHIPLYVRAGSILPLGPEIEYADQKPADPIELRIYRGADGAFDLYEDEGDNYNYEKGSYSVIPLRWNESAKTLVIEERKGNFPGMPEGHVFHIVWVSQNHGIGEAVESRIDKVIRYDGKRVSISEP